MHILSFIPIHDEPDAAGGIAGCLPCIDGVPMQLEHAGAGLTSYTFNKGEVGLRAYTNSGTEIFFSSTKRQPLSFLLDKTSYNQLEKRAREMGKTVVFGGRHDPCQEMNIVMGQDFTQDMRINDISGREMPGRIAVCLKPDSPIVFGSDKYMCLGFQVDGMPRGNLTGLANAAKEVNEAGYPKLRIDEQRFTNDLRAQFAQEVKGVERLYGFDSSQKNIAAPGLIIGCGSAVEETRRSTPFVRR